mmetsp:Transcript_25123/g.81229  ORF Transcript_25123/g.81229 Transcript_25123/m.81229 type:complete len:104 (-) Transcript_25123:1193-1504(-)
MTDYNDDGTRVGDQLEYEFPEMPAQAKSLLDITETPLDVRPVVISYGGHFSSHRFFASGHIQFYRAFMQWHRRTTLISKACVEQQACLRMSTRTLCMRTLSLQ